jgi:tetratricopeptide (TPR) repeat protein
MPTAILNGDAIFSQAIQIATAKEREIYIAQSCGNDVALRRQIEERVAAHFHSGSGSDQPTLTVAHGSSPAGPDVNNEEIVRGRLHEELPPQTTSEGQKERRFPPALVAMVAVLLAVLVIGGVILAFWTVRTEKEARRAVEKAAADSERALKEEEQLKQQRDEAEAARKATAQERDRAVEDEKTARESTEDMKTVVSFFQRNVLSAGRPVGWPGGQGKEVTLRKAVDAAEAKIPAAFVDKPLAEATIREMLGSTYLDLEAPELAVKEYERAMALRDALQGDDNPDAVACRNQLAVAYRLANHPELASQLYEPEKNSSSHASALAIRGSMLLAKKKPAEAEKLLRECLAIREKIKPDDWSLFDAQSMLGEALRDQKKYPEAEKLLLSGYEGMRKRAGKIPTEEKLRLIKELERLVLLYEAWGKQDEAKKWGTELAKEQDAVIRSTR